MTETTPHTTTPSLLNNVITIDDERIKNHLDRVRKSLDTTSRNSSSLQRNSARHHEPHGSVQS
jgi:hypothetical protein